MVKEIQEIKKMKEVIKMAKIMVTVKCEKCGCEFTHIHRCKNRTEADKYEEWAKENITVCPECYKKELEKNAYGVAAASVKKHNSKINTNIKKAVFKRAWQIYKDLVGKRIEKLSIAMKKAWEEIRTYLKSSKASKQKIVSIKYRDFKNSESNYEKIDGTYNAETKEIMCIINIPVMQ